MQKKTVIIGLSLVMLLGAGVALAGGAGCNKSAKQATTASAGSPCGSTAQASGLPCCSKEAMNQAVVALKTAAESSGCSKTAEAVAAAELAVNQAQKGAGCDKSRAAADEAAIAALKDAAEAAGCPKAKSAVEAVLVAYAKEHPAEH